MYSPGTPPRMATWEELRDWTLKEFERIATALQEQVAVDLRPVNAPPTRPREGMLVFADGTDWNPGAGRGVYVFNNGVWVKL